MLITRKIKAKVVIILLLIALLPMVLTSVIAYKIFYDAIKREALAKLSYTVQSSMADIARYLDAKIGDAIVLSLDPTNINALKCLEEEYHNSGIPLKKWAETESLSYIEKMGLNRFYEEILQVYGYQNLYLVSSNGDILYSVIKENDLGTNLISGPYKDSALGYGVGEILRNEKVVTFIDYEKYPSGSETPAAFIVHQLFDQNNNILGALVLQLSNQALYEKVTLASGIQKTGELQIVRENGSGDALFLTPLKFDKSAALNRIVDKDKGNSAVINALTGDNISLTDTIDYRGKVVYSHSGYIPDIGWGLVAKIDKNEVFEPSREFNRSIAVWIIVIAAVVIILAMYLSNRMTNSIKAISNAATSVADGDLTAQVTIKNKDEIGVLGENFNKMISNFRNVVESLKDAVDQINVTSEQIVKTSVDQASNASEQSVAVTQTSAAAEELTKSSEDVIMKVNKMSQAAQDSFNGMKTIKEYLEKSNDIIGSLGSKSIKIGKIIEIIDDIADQTNLLAINAAIEAKRAGEFGSGFTVVADEIRKLSDSTSKSTGNITDLIEIIQHEISNIQTAMEENNKYLQDGIKFSLETVENSKVISLSSKQQAIATKEISRAMEKINTSMIQISSGAEQTKKVMTVLAELAANIKKQSEKFSC